MAFFLNFRSVGKNLASMHTASALTMFWRKLCVVACFPWHNSLSSSLDSPCLESDESVSCLVFAPTCSNPRSSYPPSAEHVSYICCLRKSHLLLFCHFIDRWGAEGWRWWRGLITWRGQASDNLKRIKRHQGWSSSCLRDVSARCFYPSLASTCFCFFPIGLPLRWEDGFTLSQGRRKVWKFGQSFSRNRCIDEECKLVFVSVLKPSNLWSSTSPSRVSFDCFYARMWVLQPKFFAKTVRES